MFDSRPRRSLGLLPVLCVMLAACSESPSAPQSPVTGYYSLASLGGSFLPSVPDASGCQSLGGNLTLGALGTDSTFSITLGWSKQGTACTPPAWLVRTGRWSLAGPAIKLLDSGGAVAYTGTVATVLPDRPSLPATVTITLGPGPASQSPAMVWKK